MFVYLKSRFLARAHVRAPSKIVIFAFTTFTLFVVIHWGIMRYKQFICIHLENRGRRAENQGKWGKKSGIWITGGKSRLGEEKGKIGELSTTLGDI